MDTEKILKVENLSVSFGDFNVFHDISFEVKKGEAIAVVGPNGSGKSVLFRAILGFIPYSGQVEWTREAKIGYVPQRFFVDSNFPISVGDFFSFKTKSKQETIEALRSVGITGDERHLHHHVLSKKLG